MGDHQKSTHGRLTTHVLDTARGLPAAGLRVELYRLAGDDASLIRSIETNSDGRAEAPLLSGEEMAASTYQLVFHAGDYLRRQGGDRASPLFLDRVPIRFNIADPAEHYHVPLLLSPFGYTTYRGS